MAVQAGSGGGGGAGSSTMGATVQQHGELGGDGRDDGIMATVL